MTYISVCFFFKQKTAYEMRISDWSSDVCSSDLIHLRHDPSASASFAETHVRRLEAIRRVTGGVEREPDGTWMIAPDHLERAATFERRQVQATPLVVRTLSSLPLERQVDADRKRVR